MRGRPAGLIVKLSAVTTAHHTRALASAHASFPGILSERVASKPGINGEGPRPRPGSLLLLARLAPHAERTTMRTMHQGAAASYSDKEATRA